MDDDRLQLHQMLVDVFVGFTLYFNPQSKLILEYPCILYELQDLPVRHASNVAYSVGSVFKVTMMYVGQPPIDPKKMYTIRGASYATSFTKDDVTHVIFDVKINTM